MVGGGRLGWVGAVSKQHCCCWRGLLLLLGSVVVGRVVVVSWARGEEGVVDTLCDRVRRSCRSGVLLEWCSQEL